MDNRKGNDSMNSMMSRRSVLIGGTTIAALSGVSLTGCSIFQSNSLKIIAGSEVKDLSDIFEDFTNETGIDLDFVFKGTLDGTESLAANGSGDCYATWFPSNRYMSLLPEAKKMIQEENSIMQSPVVFGLKKDKADTFGWSEKKPPTWSQIVEKISDGSLTYGMTSPVSSNSGFSTLVEAATALSETGTALTEKDVRFVTKPLSEFAKGQKLAAGSSGWLMEKFEKDSKNVDGIFNYESLLKTVKSEKLVVLSPSDGIVTADYPLTLLKGAPEEVVERFDKFVEFLKRPETQKRIAESTQRRTTFTKSDSVSESFELAWPAQLEVIQSLLSVWVSKARKPSHSIYQIDTSGSMDGNRLSDLKNAVGTLSGSTEPGTNSERLLTLQPRETITFIEFADKIKSIETFSIEEEKRLRESTLKKISDLTNGYSANGGTAIYDTLLESFNRIVQSVDSDEIPSIVLFTDGENMDGMNFQEFKNIYKKTEKFKNVPVYSIVFGNGDSDELSELSELTGGKSFDGTEDLTSVFREIRGYQ